MRNNYNIDFENEIVRMQCWDVDNKEYVTIIFDVIDLKKVDCITNSEWRVRKTSPSNPCSYASSSSYGNTIYLHRLVMGFPPRGLETNHINGDAFDNRRSNLEAITPREHRLKDQCKTIKGRPSKLGLRGVEKQPNGMYRARYNNKTLGYFDSPEAANTCATQFREWLIEERTTKPAVNTRVSVVCDCVRTKLK